MSGIVTHIVNFSGKIPFQSPAKDALNTLKLYDVNHKIIGGWKIHLSKIPDMTSLSVFQSLLKAENDFSLASSELNRPSENVMTLCTCQSTRNSVIEFFRAYLVANNSKGTSETTLENLFNLCCKADASFCAIDISHFTCRTLQDNCVGGYCLDIEKVNHCFETAKVVKELVCAKLKVKPSELY